MNETVNSAKTFRPAGWLAFHRDSDAGNRKDYLAHASSPARSTRQSVFTTKLHGSQGPNCARLERYGGRSHFSEHCLSAGYARA